MDIRGGEETEESTARFEIKMEIHPAKKRREERSGEGRGEEYRSQLDLNCPCKPRSQCRP